MACKRLTEASMIEVYKATSAYGSSCHFGVESAARAWAGTNGTVERIELRDPPVLTVVPADDSPRWARLDELREMARQFVCHPVSRGISDCEEAGELMTDAAAEIERLCRVRNCLAGSSKTRNVRLQQLEQQRDYLLAEMRRIDGDTGNAGHYASEAISAICAEEGATAAVRDFGEESAQSLRDLRTAALLALGLLWMTERQSDKVHRAYTTLRDALGGKEALREGIQAALNAGHEADHPPGADWWAGKKDTAGAKCSHCTDNECTLKCLTAPADGVPVAGKKADRG